MLYEGTIVEDGELSSKSGSYVKWYKTEEVKQETNRTNDYLL